MPLRHAQPPKAWWQKCDCIFRFFVDWAPKHCELTKEVNVDPFLAAFGKRVKDLRLEKGIIQTDLAALCDVDRTYSYHIEKGEYYPSLRIVKNMAEAFGITLREVLHGL